jgi:hypothetical protein
MSAASPRASSRAIRDLPLAVVVRAALSERRELARRSRHRVALALTVIVVGSEMLSNPGGSGDGSGRVGALSLVAYCAALSASAALVASRRSDFSDLLHLRGRASNLQAVAPPLGRVLLVFALHGSASALLGLSGLVQASNVAAAGWTVAASAGLVFVSFLGALALSALALGCARLLPTSPWVLYWTVLLAPVLLGSALVELRGVFEFWTEANELLLLGARA